MAIWFFSAIIAVLLLAFILQRTYRKKGYLPLADIQTSIVIALLALFLLGTFFSLIWADKKFVFNPVLRNFCILFFNSKNYYLKFCGVLTLVSYTE